MSTQTEAIPLPTPAAPPEGVAAAAHAEPVTATQPHTRTRADLETELEEVKARIANADERLKTLADAERGAALDERDLLVERLHQLAAQLPYEEPEDPAPEEDNVVQLFGSAYDHARRRVVLVTPAIHTMVEEASEGFAEENTPPTIFQRARRLARFASDPLTKEQVLCDLGFATFTAVLSSMVSFCKRAAGKSGNSIRVPVAPPPLVVRALMESPPRSAPAIKRTSGCPYLRAGSGAIIREAGYQSVEGIYMLEDFTRTVSVPDAPSESDVNAARALICDELLGDFPFPHSSDRAHAIAMLLEPLMAEVIAGPFPLHVVEASVIDSGKTQLGDVFSVIARGKRNAWLNFSGEKEEQTKMLSAALLKLPSIVAIDNVAYSGHADRPFRPMPITCSSQGDHPGRDAAG
jgi:hypothetical protein